MYNIVLTETDNDIQLLVKNLNKKFHVYSLRNASSTKGNGNYLKVDNVKKWDKTTETDIRNIFDETNLHTKNYKFEIYTFDDAEKTDDMSWPATVTFFNIKK